MTYIDRAATRRIIASTDSTHVVEDRGPPKIAPPAKLHHATRFSYPFWLIAVSCVLVYGTVLPWNNVASAALQERDYMPFGSVWHAANNETYMFTVHQPHPPGGCGAKARFHDFCAASFAATKRAGLVMSEPYVISALCTPFVGMAVDRMGGRATLALVAPLILGAVHLAMGLTLLPAQFLLVGLGLGYCVFASVIWPCIPSVVPAGQVGTAYGLVTAFQNFGLFSIPLVVGIVLDMTRDMDVANPYRGVSLFFASLAAVGVGAGVLLNLNREARVALNTPGGVMSSALRHDGAWTPSPVALGRGGKDSRWTPSPVMTSLRE